MEPKSQKVDRHARETYTCTHRPAQQYTSQPPITYLELSKAVARAFAMKHSRARAPREMKGRDLTSRLASRVGCVLADTTKLVLLRLGRVAYSG